ncbi:alpha/beta hydrolase fold domain-containing protein [Paraburkholderia heleia]|uniref:alpha/beta hydrolase fold domain-containing protein n=1 Tax=Paraburkholderia heleia TaxID=634127 RepID=UPI003CD0A6B0
MQAKIYSWLVDQHSYRAPLARDAGVPLPAALVAFSPGLDHTRHGATTITKEGVDPLFTREGMGHTGAMYLAGQNPQSPLLTPAVHADLSGFPPILLP